MNLSLSLSFTLFVIVNFMNRSRLLNYSSGWLFGNGIRIRQVSALKRGYTNCGESFPNLNKYTFIFLKWRRDGDLKTEIMLVCFYDFVYFFLNGEFFALKFSLFN